MVGEITVDAFIRAAVCVGGGIVGLSLSSLGVEAIVKTTQKQNTANAHQHDQDKGAERCLEGRASGSRGEQRSMSGEETDHQAHTDPACLTAIAGLIDQFDPSVALSHRICSAPGEPDSEPIVR